MKNLSKERLMVIADVLVDLALETVDADSLIRYLEANGCTADELIALGLEV
jgi:hypothetical protein